jgi:hypothetical protein
MMASDVKKTKADPAPKKADPAPRKEKADPAAKKEAAPGDKSTSDAAPAKAEGGEAAAAAPKDYSRGEGQKPVTQAYKDNWNAIFATKKKKKR